MKRFQRIALVIAHIKNIIFVWVRFWGGTGGKVESKLEKCHFSREIRGNCSNFDLEG